MKTHEEVVEMIKRLEPQYRCEGRYVKYRGNESWHWRLRGNLEMLGWLIDFPNIVEEVWQDSPWKDRLSLEVDEKGRRIFEEAEAIVSTP